jgi:proline iminopeptidase
MRNNEMEAIMIRYVKYFSLILTITLTAACCSTHSAKEPTTAPKPYKTGYLKVGQGQEIFYQLGGNPDGRSVMVLHGGPGGYCTPDMFQYFDLKKYNVILHDQRGCGQSHPKNDLTGNNTQSLVNDIEKLRTHFKLGKVVLFGGSWGSTLALAYAETYPDHVSGIILRGVFTATKAEIDQFYHGGTADHFPEVFARLQKAVDHPETLNYPQQLLDKLQSDDAAVRAAAARAWTGYEIRLVSLDMTDARTEEILDKIGPAGIYTFALMENWYMAHNCFLEEGQLLRDATRIADIPVIMVQGRYDVICLPRAAWNLHKVLPKSKLWFAADSGHSSHEPNITRLLKKAAAEFE